MPASCPYCGATLNFGLKFCVVCGRHTSAADMSKMGGGLKSGIKQADLTRRLDDNLSAGDFERARKPTRLRKHIRSLSEHIFYVFIGAALFFCAIRFTLQTYFPGRIHKVLVPILGKQAAAVEQTLTGQSKDEDNVDEDEDNDKTKATATKTPAKGATKSTAPQDKKKKKSKSSKKHAAK